MSAARPAHSNAQVQQQRTNSRTAGHAHQPLVRRPLSDNESIFGLESVILQQRLNQALRGLKETEGVQEKQQELEQLRLQLEQ